MHGCRDGSRVGELKEALSGMSKLPEIVVGQQGAEDVARHPDAVSVVTGIVGQQTAVAQRFCSASTLCIMHWSANVILRNCLPRHMLLGIIQGGRIYGKNL